MQMVSRSLIIAGDDNTIERDESVVSGVITKSPKLIFGAVDPVHPLAAVVTQILVALSDLPLGQALLNTAENARYHLEFANADDHGVQVDSEARVLYVPSHLLSPAATTRSVYFTHELQMNLVRGLRLIDQAERGTRLRYLHPAQALFAARIAMADQMAVAMHLLYGMRHVCPSLWRHVLGSDIGDMASRFADGALRMQGMRMDSVAQTRCGLNAAFLLWYRDDERLNAVDAASLDLLDEQMQTSKTPGLYRARLTDDMILNLCDVEGMGSYLNDLSLSAVRSPLGETVFDPINARHLQQIIAEQDMVMINNIGFRDPLLARAIFPET